MGELGSRKRGKFGRRGNLKDRIMGILVDKGGKKEKPGEASPGKKRSDKMPN